MYYDSVQKCISKTRRCDYAVDVKWSEGSCSGTVYSGDEKLTQLMAKVIIIIYYAF